MTTFTTRPALTDDLADILRMIQALSAFHGDEATVTAEQLAAIYFGDRAKGCAFVAFADSRPVGYAGLIEGIHVHWAKPRFDIHHLFVEEDLRGKGVGRALIAAVRDYARSRGAKGLTIGTDPDNQLAQASYRAMGLEEITGHYPRFWVTCDEE